MSTYLATFDEADDGTYRWLVYRVTRELGGAMSTLVTMGEAEDEDDALECRRPCCPRTLGT